MKKSALVLSVLLSLWTQAASADQYVEYGIQMLKQKNYKAADKYFEQRLKLVPKDENAHYYRALAAHYSGDKAKTRELYQFVIDNFPGSAMAKKATTGIKMMDEAEEKARIAAEEAAKKAEEEAAKNPGAKPAAKPPEPGKPPAAAKQAGATKTAGSVNAALPTHLPTHGETRVHFEKIDNNTVFSAKINGKPTQVNFDPNSEKNWIKKEEFANFGITGNGPEWKVRVQVGSISKVISVGLGADWEPRPKLGIPFLEDLEYEIDTAGNTLVFRSGIEKAATAASDLYVVPFRRKGNDLIVDVQVKGKKSAMKVNTNSNEIRLSKTNFDQLDMQIPIFCKKEGEIYSFAIDEMLFGKIKLNEPFVFVTLPEDGSAGEPEGTFGLKYLDWRYTVDNKNNCLRFYH